MYNMHMHMCMYPFPGPFGGSGKVGISPPTLRGPQRHAHTRTQTVQLNLDSRNAEPAEFLQLSAVHPHVTIMVTIMSRLCPAEPVAGRTNLSDTPHARSALDLPVVTQVHCRVAALICVYRVIRTIVYNA